MSYTTQSLTELASSVHVKDVISFSLNAQFLNHNFSIVKQCLLKINELQGSLEHEKQESKSFTIKLRQIEADLAKSKNQINKNKEQIRQLQDNIGDEFMKKIYGIEQKTKNMSTFDDTVIRLQALNKFVTTVSFAESQKTLKEEIVQVKKIKNEFERYVQKNSLQAFKGENNLLHIQKANQITHLNMEIDRLSGLAEKNTEKLHQTTQNIAENTKMIKEINFAQMLQKNKKFRDDTDQKVNDLILKMKKKVGSNQLLAFQQTMVSKLDNFLTDNEKNKAVKIQTKNALIFLEKRISDIQDIFAEKASEDDKDALFSVKKWQCASCTKDLGKFEGKLGQYRPWSIFPCKELDPEKIGGFGYMSYLDKVSIKKGGSTSQEPIGTANTERMNKTFYEKERQSSPKRGGSTVRNNNLISNYGSEEKGGASLKDMYFRQLKTQKGERTTSKFFRVKKESSKPANQFQKSNEV